MTFIYKIARDASDRDRVFVELVVVNDETPRKLGVLHMRRDELTAIEDSTHPDLAAEVEFEFEYLGEDS